MVENCPPPKSLAELQRLNNQGPATKTKFNFLEVLWGQLNIFLARLCPNDEVNWPNEKEEKNIIKHLVEKEVHRLKDLPTPLGQIKVIPRHEDDDRKLDPKHFQPLVEAITPYMRHVHTMSIGDCTMRAVTPPRLLAWLLLLAAMKAAPKEMFLWLESLRLCGVLPTGLRFLEMRVMSVYNSYTEKGDTTTEVPTIMAEMCPNLLELYFGPHTPTMDMCKIQGTKSRLEDLQRLRSCTKLRILGMPVLQLDVLEDFLGLMNNGGLLGSLEKMNLWVPCDQRFLDATVGFLERGHASVQYLRLHLVYPDGTGDDVEPSGSEDELLKLDISGILRFFRTPACKLKGFSIMNAQGYKATMDNGDVIGHMGIINSLAETIPKSSVEVLKLAPLDKYSGWQNVKFQMKWAGKKRKRRQNESD